MSVAGHGLSQTTVNEIAAIFARFPAVESAILFGSRAKGIHRHGSDIDLAFIGDEGLDSQTLGKIEEALDDSLLPYCFSLLILNRITDRGLKEQIRRVGRLFYERSLSPADARP